MARTSASCCSSAAAGWPISSWAPAMSRGPWRTIASMRSGTSCAGEAGCGGGRRPWPWGPAPACPYPRERISSSGRPAPARSRRWERPCRPGQARTRRMTSRGHGPRTRERRLPGGVAHPVLVGQVVQPRLQVVVENELGGGQAGVELPGAARSDDGRRNGLVRQHPGHREGHQVHPGLPGQLAERVDGVEFAVVPVTVLVVARGVAQGEAGPFWGRRGTRVLTGQQAAGDRVVRDDTDALLAAEREHFPLDLAEEQVVPGLDRVEAGQPERLTPADGAHQLIGEEVRAAGVTDLP